MLINGSTYELEPFSITVNVDADALLTTITYPDGIAYDSHVLTAGTFDGTLWEVLLYEKNVTRTLTITVVVTDIGAFTALVPEDRIVEGDTDVLVGEEVVVNNHAEKLIEEETCLDVLYCGMGELVEFDSMSEAVDELGEGMPFLASLENIEGWSYRAVLVTPFS